MSVDMHEWKTAPRNVASFTISLQFCEKPINFASLSLSLCIFGNFKYLSDILRK